MILREALELELTVKEDGEEKGFLGIAGHFE